MSVGVLDEFTVGFRSQREWRWLILLAFFLGGVGGGLFLISMFTGFVPGLIAGLIVVIVGKGSAHIMFLGRPERFWRIFAAPQSSWISRGIYIVTVFSVFGILYALAHVPQLGVLPWAPETPLGRVVQGIAILAGLLLVTYTGFVMAYSPAIQLWSTPLLPALFGLYSLSAGIAGLFLMLPFVGKVSLDVKGLETLEIALIACAIVFLGMYVLTMLYSTVGAKEGVRSLIYGQLAPVFWGGVVVVGLILPLILVVVAYQGLIPASSIPPIVGAAGLLELLGGFLLRHCLLRAGIFAPVV